MGQHFLVDNDIARRQVEYAAVEKDDTVLEIGPGLGILTRQLVRHADKVIAVEKDPKLAGIVSEEVPEAEVIVADVLDLELPKFDKVVSNLPFNISTPVTFMILEHEFKLGVLMYQREFAARMVSGPGSKAYGRLSISVYCRADAKPLETVPSSSFVPEPKVESMIVLVLPRDMPFEVKDRTLFERVVEAAFGQRRKMLRNSLGRKERWILGREAGVDWGSIPYADKRPEQLAPQQLGEIADALFDIRSKK